MGIKMERVTGSSRGVKARRPPLWTCGIPNPVRPTVM